MTTPCTNTKCVVPNRYQYIPIRMELQSESKMTVDVWCAAIVAKFTDTCINGDFNLSFQQTVVLSKRQQRFSRGIREELNVRCGHEALA